MQRFASMLAVCVLLDGCAGQECDFNSQCGERFYCLSGRCRQDCRVDTDCATGERCSPIGQCRPASEVDAGPPPFDAGPMPGVDAGPMPGVDAGPMMRVDAGPMMGTDAGPMPGTDAGPLGRYLDRCATSADCMSGRCVPDVGGTNMCTRTCSAHADCAVEHVCASGECRRDDIGTVCSGAAGCVLNLCAGNPMTGIGRCTHTCASASECPAGYACADAGGAFVCVDIEQPCATCPTGQCLASGQGCTSPCRSVADCPLGIPTMGYTCTSGLCVPSPFVLGPDPIGATCSASGTNTCRSGGCLPSVSRNLCTQRCSEQGGCGPGYGCTPTDDGMGGVLLVCDVAGTGALGSACTTGGQCDSGLCAGSPGYCTRLCTTDLLCPTGYTCRPNGPFSICER
ncbi:MAG: hypothetical protein AB7S26_21370 [Sandaracinaceae bacterium]